MIQHPAMQCLDNRLTSFLAYLSSSFRRLATNFRLDGVEPGDLGQHLGGKRRLRRSMELKERTTQVGPTER
jgi:hypothetical protein